MARVITDGTGTPVKRAYEPPQAPQRREAPAFGEDLIRAFSEAIAQGLRVMPAPVVNVPKPEVKVNSPVYVQPPEIKIPATTVNVPEGRAPVVHIEPPNVTVQVHRPKEWEFDIFRNEYGQMTKIKAKAL